MHSVDTGDNANLELMDKFCYLGDMLSVNGDANAAVETRIWTGWNKFRQLVPLLTNKDISLIVTGRLYSSCVQSSMLHGSETWPTRKENEVALQWAEMWMVRWMCGIKLQVKGWERETRIRWNNFGITAKQVAMVWARAAKRRQWLGEEMYGVWSGWCQAKRKTKKCEIMEKDCQVCKLNKEDAMDRKRWRKQIRGDWWPH